MTDVANALPSQPTHQGVGRVPALAGSVVGRVGHEVSGIWRDARALSRGQGAVVDDQAGTLSSNQVYLAWYGGLATMALLRLIEWRLAAMVAAVHTIERHAHRRRVREYLEGVDAGGL
jgi:hypothetical protein